MSAPPIPHELARAVRVVIFDIDGVLTDAGVYVGADADGRAIELKRFDIQDGTGIKLLKAAGIVVGLVSGRLSPANRLRAEELGVAEWHEDARVRKVAIVEGILDRAHATWAETAMLADDIPDLAAFRRAGLRAAVANAQPEILALAHWRSAARGGHGAVREFCRALLAARGEWDRLVGEYERGHG